MNLDLGYGVIQMINISSKTLEAMIEDLQDILRSLSHQEVEARTQIHKQC